MIIIAFEKSGGFVHNGNRNTLLLLLGMAVKSESGDLKSYRDEVSYSLIERRPISSKAY